MTNRVIVVSAPAGAGKDSILNIAIPRLKNLKYAVSATTRSPRVGETDGVHYHFKTVEEFLSGIEKGEFLEYANYSGNYYGMPKKSVEDILDEGNSPLLKIDIEGANSVRKIFKDAFFIFIMPPSLEVLEKRLRERSTETEEAIAKRLLRAKEEIEFAKLYNEIIVNDDLETAAAKFAEVFMRAVLV